MQHNPCTIPLILSTLAGLSTMIGTLIIFITKKPSSRLISFALAFASGVMITISLTDLLPFSIVSFIKYFGKFKGTFFSLIFFIIGLTMSLLIEKLIPDTKRPKDNCSCNLFKIGCVTMIALMIHNFPEGITTFISGYQNINLGIYIAFAIALHNIPEGISIAMPIYCSTGSKKKALKYTFLSAIAEPLGALIAFLFLKPFINEIILSICYSLVAGIMIFISIHELLPESRINGHTKVSLFSVILGICVITLSHSII